METKADVSLNANLKKGKYCKSKHKGEAVSEARTRTRRNNKATKR